MSDGKANSNADTRILLGQYSNHFRVGSNAVEFVVEFGQFYQDYIEPCYHTRIITSPRYAKELVDILTEAISDYESYFGLFGEEK